MTIKDVVTPERIVFLNSESRTDVIKSLVPVLASAPGMPNVDQMEVAFLQREEMMSTGIGMGIGVPHIRLPGINSLVMAIGIHKTGIFDYPAIDNLPVKIVAMIAAGVSQHGEYIRMLANVVTVLKRDEARKSILDTDSADEVYRIICQQK
ncbi:MAG: PTS sugar transporter subunit IIA [Kiritimatiellae bacterium]|jgi:PTS system nitrogen regulatory IIA component|nr:PTS sugar transporter subunit IIA [Kiritimatiellia bacterium]